LIPAVVTGNQVSPSATSSERDVVDESLDAISASLGRLKSRSLAISEDIKRQNLSLESTVTSVDRSVASFKDQHKRISK
jgi:hypothetical protein